MNKIKVAVIGCGNLGTSMVQGLLKSDNYSDFDLIATTRNNERIKMLNGLGVTTTSDNLFAAENSEVIILGVKPYNAEKVIKEISAVLNPDKHIIVSPISSLDIAQIVNYAGMKLPVFRIMPNIASSVHESITCMSYQYASTNHIQLITDLHNLLGEVLVIKEDQMEAATIIGACGIAYVMRFMRAMVQGGIEIGLDAASATKIVNQTVKGAAELLLTNGNHPEAEIDKVTTPKGCTITGLNEMEHQGFSAALIRGILVSYKLIEK